MRLGDIPDMERYLEEDCYCPGEVYDLTGFFCRVYHADDECTLLYSGEKGAIHGLFVQVDNQVLYVETNADKVLSCVRYDATEHNVDVMRRWLRGEEVELNFDEFKPGTTEKQLYDILDVANAIMIH